MSLFPELQVRVVQNLRRRPAISCQSAVHQKHSEILHNPTHHLIQKSVEQIHFQMPAWVNPINPYGPNPIDPIMPTYPNHPFCQIQTET